MSRERKRSGPRLIRQYKKQSRLRTTLWTVKTFTNPRTTKGTEVESASQGIRWTALDLAEVDAEVNRHASLGVEEGTGATFQKRTHLGTMRIMPTIRRRAEDLETTECLEMIALSETTEASAMIGALEMIEVLEATEASGTEVLGMIAGSGVVAGEEV